MFFRCNSNVSASIWMNVIMSIKNEIILGGIVLNYDFKGLVIVVRVISSYWIMHVTKSIVFSFF